METSMNFVKTIVAAGLVAASTSAFAADITGAGATFPFPIYSKRADAYKKETGNGLTYQSIGSGAGIKQIQAKTVTFGATDAPLKHETLEKDGLVQWPMVMGAIVPVVNLEGIKPGELVLSGEVLGDIYLGKIKKWDDAAIAKLNPKLKLPADAITVVRRSDGSGTTFNFTDYLSKSNAEWKAKAGSGTAVEWPTADGAKAPGYYVILTDQPGEASWPITAATFILMHKDATDKAASQEAIKFFKWSFEKGAKMAEELDYIPMPESVVKLIEKTWTAEIRS